MQDTLHVCKKVLISRNRQVYSKAAGKKRPFFEACFSTEGRPEERVSPQTECWAEESGNHSA